MKLTHLDYKAAAVGANDLGPIAIFASQVFVFLAFTLNFGVLGFSFFPALTSVLLLLIAFGVAILAPKKTVMRMPVSISIIMMLGWIVASLIWTDNPINSTFVLKRDIPILVGMTIIAGLVNLKDLVPALLWQIRFAIGITIFTLITNPATRVHYGADGNFLIDGWHGLFIHKNVMTPYLVFAVVTVLTFERNKTWRLLSFAGIAALLIGSDSVTGLASAVMVIGIWIWVQLYRDLDVRSSSVFVVATIALGATGLIAAVVSIGELVSATGKDLTFTGRTFIWEATLTAIQDRPFFGYGYGGIFSFNPITPTTAAVWRDIDFQVPHAHSGALDLVVQLGIVGLVLYLILWISVITGGVRLLSSRPEAGAWILSVCTIQGFISLSENVFLGTGWLLLIIMFRVLLLKPSAADYGEQSRVEDVISQRRRFVEENA